MEHSIREKLYHLIESCSEEQLEEMYEFLQNDNYTDDMKAMLDKEYDDYQANKETVSKEEVDNIIQNLLYNTKP